LVPEQIHALFDWAKGSEVHPLIKSCIFHYEFEFIHPSADGNGRMGRMWQTLFLYNWKNMFGWLPVETLIKARQEEYYKVLGICDKEADSGKFIDFILQAICDALIGLENTEQVGLMSNAKGNKPLTTNEMMEAVGIKHRPMFRDNYLKPAMTLGFIEMTIPSKPNSSKQKYIKIRGLK